MDQNPGVSLGQCVFLPLRHCSEIGAVRLGRHVSHDLVDAPGIEHVVESASTFGGLRGEQKGFAEGTASASRSYRYCSDT
jgi:hypothetical protein